MATPPNTPKPAKLPPFGRSRGAIVDASRAPLHRQVRDAIRRQVREGELVDNSGRLMSETEAPPGAVPAGLLSLSINLTRRAP